MATAGLSKAKAQNYIESFRSARVLVLGDVMLDRYFWGEVDRISPEAPVPIVRVDRRSARLGGAANVAANLEAVGVEVAVAGLIGDDRAGDEVRSLLDARAIDASCLQVGNRHETTEKVRIIAQSQQVVRADFETRSVEVETQRDLLRLVADKSSDYDALIVSDYGKGVVGESPLRDIIGVWRAAKKPVLVDPHIGHFRWYRGATLITPNTREAASYFQAGFEPDQLVGPLAVRMREELELDALLITRGEEGMALFLDDGSTVQIATDAEEVYDVTGAGDTVIGILGAGVASGAPLVDAVIMANRAAGEVVKEVGTTAITRDELLAAFD